MKKRRSIVFHIKINCVWVGHYLIDYDSTFLINCRECSTYIDSTSMDQVTAIDVGSQMNNQSIEKKKMINEFDHASFLHHIIIFLSGYEICDVGLSMSGPNPNCRGIRHRLTVLSLLRKGTGDHSDPGLANVLVSLGKSWQYRIWFLLGKKARDQLILQRPRRKPFHHSNPNPILSRVHDGISW